MFLLPMKLDRVSFETKGKQNLQKKRIVCLHLRHSYVQVTSRNFAVRHVGGPKQRGVI